MATRDWIGRVGRTRTAGAEPAPGLLASGWGKWVLFLAGWTVLSIFLAPEVYLYYVYKQEPIPWYEAIALPVVNAAIAALFAPAIIWLAGRFPVERRQLLPSLLLVHLPACAVFSVAHSVLYANACYASPRLSEALFFRFHPNILTYWAIVAIAQAIRYFEKYKERERQLAQAQLDLLRMQLHPHFLFNTLHTISAMMHEDVKGADQMISRLSELLRMTLDSIGKQAVPLRQEIDFIKGYVEIERIRHQDRIELVLDIDPAALDAVVPTMLLQPLVENSIKHGFAARREGGTVTVRARILEGVLTLTVLDNGRGLAPGGVPGGREGMGLGTTRRRLEQLYPLRHRFHIEAQAAGGTAVTIELPSSVGGGARGGAEGA